MHLTFHNFHRVPIINIVLKTNRLIEKIALYNCPRAVEITTLFKLAYTYITYIYLITYYYKMRDTTFLTNIIRLVYA